MYAIAFDMIVREMLKTYDHPAQGYSEIQAVMESYGFERKQGSLYTTDNEDMATVFKVMTDLRSRPWFVDSVRDIPKTDWFSVSIKT